MAVDRTLMMFAEAARTREEGGSGGEAGDQFGVELRTQRWYEHDPVWATVIRLEDPALAERVAQFMERIVLNGFVGYDQSNRKSLEEDLIKVGYDPSALHFPCETDCSMTAYEAVKWATGISCDAALGSKGGVDFRPPASGSLPTTYDSETGLCGETYFRITGRYPVGTNMHYYMCRLLPLKGIKVSSYTLTGKVSGTQRSDFHPQENYVYTYNGAYVTSGQNGGGRLISYTAPGWKDGYYDTPYQRIGITKAQIDAGTVPAEYINTIGGVTYYNEFGRAVALYNADYTDRPSAPSSVTATKDGGTATYTLGLQRISPYNALTYEQVGKLGTNYHSYVSNSYEAGYLTPTSGKTFPENLKRGDLIFSRIRYSGSSTDAGYLSDNTRVSAPASTSVGHVAIWI